MTGYERERRSKERYRKEMWEWYKKYVAPKDSLIKKHMAKLEQEKLKKKNNEVKQ